MRIDKRIGVFYLLVTLSAGCSNSLPPSAPASSALRTEPAPTPAKPAGEATKEAPKVVAVSPAASAAKAKGIRPKEAPPVPAAAPQSEAFKEAIANAPPALEPPAVPPPGPAAPPEPPERTTRQVILPAGTVVSVRMTDPVNSETGRAGQTFRATLDVPLAVDQETIAARGSEIYLRLTHVESAGNLTGRSEVALELDRILIGGKSYTVASNIYEKAGASQGAQTAKHAGIGAAIGAAVGAIAGGKKGAAIGAGVGGGTGVAIEAATKGQQVQIESESRLDFHLEQPLEVTVESGPSTATAPRDFSSGPRLLNAQRRAITDSSGDVRPDLSGKWRMSIDSPQGGRSLDLTLKQSGDRLEGTLWDRGRGEPLKGTVRGDSLTFSTDSSDRGQAAGMRFEGRIADDRLRGKVTIEGAAGFGGGRQGGRGGNRGGRGASPSFNWSADRND